MKCKIENIYESLVFFLILLPMCAPSENVDNQGTDFWIDSDPKPTGNGDADADSDIDADADADADTDTDADADTDTDADADTDSDADADSDTDADADSDTDTDTDTDADADSDTDSDTDSDSDNICQYTCQFGCKGGTEMPGICEIPMQTCCDMGGDGDADTDTDTNTDADTDTDTDGDCNSEFNVNTTLSSKISTVGIVEWSLSGTVSNASIDFGQDTSYEYTAPVDLDEPNNRTLLLGMKASTTYHYRIVTESGGNKCASEDYTIETGPLPVGLPSIKVTDNQPSGLSGDFIITTTGGYALILDGDGDYVWWYQFSDGSRGSGNTMAEELCRAHMSGDGKSMWATNLNVGGGGGQLFRIGMDGVGSAETIKVENHHDFCVLPDNSVAYIEFDRAGSDTCDKIVERNASGQTKTIYALRTDFSALSGSGGMMGNEWCHCNAIHYVPSQDAYYVSVLNQSMMVKVNRSSGSLEWAIDGDGNTVSGVKYISGATWSRQHGHHPLENGDLLIFNNGNGGFGGGGTSYALGFSINEGSSSATEFWRYTAGSSSMTLGDVQEMSNGNILVVYSNNGLIHEVAPDQTSTPLRSMTASGFGYAEARSSLYGPPERY